MNGKGIAHYKSFEDNSRIYISPALIWNREALQKQHSLDSQQKSAARQASIRQLEELKKDPNMYKKLIDTVIESEKTLNSVLTYEFNFEIHYYTQFGERLVITGEPEFLGSWDPLKGLELEWNFGNVWKANIVFGEGVLEDFKYKYVCIKKHEIVWEKGNNRNFNITDGVKQSTHIVFNKNDSWHD